MSWPVDADDARVMTALQWTCDICRAPVNTLCSNTIQPDQPLPGRIIHLGRLLDRRRDA